MSAYQYQGHWLKFKVLGVTKRLESPWVRGPYVLEIDPYTTQVQYLYEKLNFSLNFISEWLYQICNFDLTYD